MDPRQIAEIIKKNDNYIVSSHINLEGDAIGSELALFYLLKQLGKRAVILNNDPVPDRYKFLPGWDNVIVGDNGRQKEYGAIIIVDCPTVERSGNIAQLIRNSKIKINIDHHVSNENFGDFNWVDAEAGSCGEMIFNLYKEIDIKINKDVALMLYVAILTDTGSFRYNSTTCKTHSIAGELIRLGVNPEAVANKIYETKTLGDVRLLSKALSTITVNRNGKITYMYVTRNMMVETGTAPDRTEGFINFAKEIEGAEVSLFFRQDIKDPRKIHVGFRSKGKANVNELAANFKGGGHPRASGCLMIGDLREVIKKVLKVTEEFLS